MSNCGIPACSAMSSMASLLTKENVFSHFGSRSSLNSIGSMCPASILCHTLKAMSVSTEIIFQIFANVLCMMLDCTMFCTFSCWDNCVCLACFVPVDFKLAFVGVPRRPLRFARDALVPFGAVVVGKTYGTPTKRKRGQNEDCAKTAAADHNANDGARMQSRSLDGELCSALGIPNTFDDMARHAHNCWPRNAHAATTCSGNTKYANIWRPACMPCPRTPVEQLNDLC